jgi:hypothetical protein
VQHRPRQRKWPFAVGAAVFFLLSLYCAGGAVQGAMLFVGVKALRNWSLWSSLALAAAVAGWVCTWLWLSRGPLGAVRARVLAAVSALTALGFAYAVVQSFLAVDRCLDSGGSFNYVASACDTVTNHPSVGFLEGNGLGVTGTFVFALAAACLLLVARRARQAPSNSAL